MSLRTVCIKWQIRKNCNTVQDRCNFPSNFELDSCALQFSTYELRVRLFGSDWIVLVLFNQSASSPKSVDSFER